MKPTPKNKTRSVKPQSDEYQGKAWMERTILRLDSQLKKLDARVAKLEGR